MEQLHITKACLQKVTNYRVSLDFEVNQHTYSMCVTKGEQAFFPTEIFHETREKCAFCNNESYHCPGIEKYMHPLFQQLIEHPSIRLEWLFLEHPERNDES